MSNKRRGRLRGRGPRLDPEGLGSDLLDRLLRVDHALLDLAGGDSAPQGFSPDRFIAPGVPRIRPVLVLLSARAADPTAVAGHRAEDQDEAAAHVAGAAELLHVAITLHDAALGKQGGRRRRAARRIIGRAVGLLGGHHVTIRALELAQHAPAPGLTADLLDAMREIADGQALAHDLRDRFPTVDESLAFAEGRTGAVFSFACRAGGRLARAERPVVTLLGRYGRHAGIAWHLAEDIAFLEKEGEELARGLEERAVDGRPHFAVSAAAEEDGDLVQAWGALAKNPDEESALQLAEMVRQTGAMGRARERMAKEAWSARQALSGLDPSPEKEALDKIAAGLLWPAQGQE